MKAGKYFKLGGKVKTTTGGKKRTGWAMLAKGVEKRFLGGGVSKRQNDCSGFGRECSYGTRIDSPNPSMGRKPSTVLLIKKKKTHKKIFLCGNVQRNL